MAQFSPYITSQSNHSHIMDLNLHSAHAHMDMLTDVAYQWLKDEFDENENLHFSCVNLHFKCELLQNTLDNLLSYDAEDESGNESDFDEVCESFSFFFFVSL